MEEEVRWKPQDGERAVGWKEMNEEERWKSSGHREGGPVGASRQGALCKSGGGSGGSQRPV